MTIDLVLLEAMLNQPEPSADAVLGLLSHWQVEWAISRTHNLRGEYGRIWCRIGGGDEPCAAPGATIDEAVLAAVRKLVTP